jgi:niacin transporter
MFAALALAIPFAFRGTLQFIVPGTGYTATLASHVPVMLSTAVGPIVSAIVGFASTLGFFVTLGPVVAARASTHILWGVATAFAIKKGMSFPKALFLVALPLHAIPEGLVVIPFGFTYEAALLNVVGTAAHHTVDSIISIAVLRAARPLLDRFRQSPEST